jgi:hypothetical protein
MKCSSNFNSKHQLRRPNTNLPSPAASAYRGRGVSETLTTETKNDEISGYLILGVAVGAIVYTNGSVVGAWLLIVSAGIAIYFLPALIALHRGHHQILAIFLLNLFLGWSFLG